MFSRSEILLDELIIALERYANHIDIFVQRIASNENIKIYNSYHNSLNKEDICVQAMIYESYRIYCEKLIDFDLPIPDIPQLINTKLILKNINKKGTSLFLKQNDLKFSFSALSIKAGSCTDLATSFKESKFMHDFIQKKEIQHINRCIKNDLYLLETFEKGTWKILRDKIKKLDSYKF
ncbi:MAG: hypothetical protein P8H22_09810 [Glaciecola sp.]|nr:hypothetical protein [Glaciecola sp.]